MVRLYHIRPMNFNELKRKAFFWVERLQISRGERIGIALLLGIIVLLLAANLFLRRSYNYNQENYGQILAEFQKRNEAAEQEKAALIEKYSPGPEVNRTEKVKETEPAAPPSEEPSSTPETTASKIININTADLKTLQTLKGIGPTYAKRIIEYRQTNNGFDSIDELVNVKGIGEKRLENIRPYIKLED